MPNNRFQRPVCCAAQRSTRALGGTRHGGLRSDL